ncbi:uncharacterized protein LOC143282784 [Babylonia areolata]|uniref:uncharacterized protein LOC143282784 n=1 Tax=Babylonia areolata TaxID=304850 RepID=UPI003FCF9959
MIRFLSRMAVIAVSTSVVVPYTVATLCHLLYSHDPQKGRSLLRSLKPKRVYALSVAVMQKMVLYVRYAHLYIQWNQYYMTADPSIMVKNLAYGRNNCCLDLHLPLSHRLIQPISKRENKPVVVFVYGGAWSSGDKSMYGALCAQLVESLDVLVCCPNHSTYPQGCVDDMIQDIVDCIQWIHNCIHDYGGDKNKIMLIGHSSGAHLCSMTLLELLHDQQLHVGPFPPEVTEAASMLFHESHYGRQFSHNSGHGGKDPLEDSSGSSESFAVVSENGNSNKEGEASGMDSSMAGTLTSMVEVSHSDITPELEQMQSSTAAVKHSAEKGDSVESKLEMQDQGSGGGDHGVKVHSQEVGEAEEESGEEDDDNDSVVTVRPKDIERHSTLIDMAHSIKAFVGLAGVYHIGDHYQFETWRGIEHMSGMMPAMYGPEHFERFSPSTILLSLEAPISLPRMVLVHGTDDYVVPVTSSQKFTERLSRVAADVSLRLIPECDHYDICFDLMKPSRRFHASLMTLLLETTNSVF